MYLFKQELSNGETGYFLSRKRRNQCKDLQYIGVIPLSPITRDFVKGLFLMGSTTRDKVNELITKSIQLIKK